MTRPDWKDFESKFENTISDDLRSIKRQLSKSRSKRNTILLRYIILSVSFIISMLYIFDAFNIKYVYMLFVMMASFAIIQTGISRAKLTGLRVTQRLKELIVTAAAEHYNLNYVANGQILNPADFVKRGVIPKFKYETREDGFVGRIDGLLCASVEAHLQQKGRFLKKGERFTVFRGLLVRCKSPHSTPAPVLVLKDGGAFDRTAKHLRMGLFSEMERVRLEDPKFQEQFEVYSKDQITARVLLSPTKQEAFKKFARTTAPFQAFFESDEVWMAIDIDYNAFEAHDLDDLLISDALDAERVKRILRDIGRLWDIPPLLHAR